MTASKLLSASTALMLAIAMASPASGLAEGRGHGHGRAGPAREGNARFAEPVAPADRGWNRGWHHRGWWPGAAFETGTRMDASDGYFQGPYDDDSDYADSYDDSDEAVSPAPSDGDTSYCVERFRSYDPASGTYLGYDGQRHPCP